MVLKKNASWSLHKNKKELDWFLTSEMTLQVRIVQFSHILCQFQLNGSLRQSASVVKYVAHHNLIRLVWDKKLLHATLATLDGLQGCFNPQDLSVYYRKWYSHSLLLPVIKLLKFISLSTKTNSFRRIIS